MLNTGTDTPSLAVLFGRQEAVVVAPPYEPPTEPEQPPPVGEPEPPPGEDPVVDPGFTEPTRIDIVESGKTVIRNNVDPGTWGNAYVNVAAEAMNYCELSIDPSTPKDATLAVGFSTLDMPLNGVPGKLSTTIAHWSDGRVFQNNAVLGNLPVFGRRNNLGLMLTRLLALAVSKGCVISVDEYGDLSAAGKPLYVFVGMYSTGARAKFSFAVSDFACGLPPGYVPLGAEPLPYNITPPQIYIGV